MRIGSLFSGYGGLDLAVQSAIGGTLAWVSDIEPGPSRVLAHHHPDVPNLGDITAIDWTTVEPVDIICGGSPCQDLSHAGRRAGMRDGTRSGLWASMREAIETIRPAYVIWENVLGALSASAASDMGPCELGMGCEGSVSLRALGRVLGDLTEVGYDAAWTTLAAADIGAPHRRERVFVLAWPAEDAERTGRGLSRHTTTGEAPSGRPPAVTGGPDRTPLDLLPTPAVNDMGAGKTVEEWDDWTDAMRARHGNGNGHGKSLSIEAQRLLPTPRATDGTKGGPNQRGSSGDLMPPSAVINLQQGDGHARTTKDRPKEVLRNVRQGVYAEAIWEATGGSNAIPVTETLLPEMREHAGCGHERREPLACEAEPQASVRKVRLRNQSARASHRQGSSEQRSRQPADTVCDLPPETPLVRGSRAPACGCEAWGHYAPAVHRWELILGRPAPSPVEVSRPGGQPRLSPRAVEFMMGLPDGWVTDVPGLSRNNQLRALGNGVVPLQCEAALRHLLALIDQEEAA